MHILHQNIWIPKISQNNLDEKTSVFQIQPLPRWYGITLANSIRRVALSSVPWARVTGIKVKGVSHEYSTLPWVKDSVIDIMLNLKSLVIDVTDSWISWVKLKKNTAWVVTASDISFPSDIKVVNPDMYITEIDQDKLELDIEIRIEKWVWYMSIEDLKKREEDVNVLLIDANFSPVESVKYNIESTRVWDNTNLDAIEMTIITTWVLSPVEVFKFSGNMLASYFWLLNEDSLQIEGEFIGDIKNLLSREKEEVKEELEKESYTPIEIMGLSPRTLNALINWNILSVEQLTKCTETKLSSIKWFWKKAMTEIRSSLAERGLKLLWDD